MKAIQDSVAAYLQESTGRPHRGRIGRGRGGIPPAGGVRPGGRDGIGGRADGRQSTPTG